MNESELIDRLPAAVREEFEGICSEIEGLKRERDVLAQQVSQNEADTNSFTGARAVLLRTAAVFIEMQGPVVQTAMMPRHFNDASVPAAPIERGERADIRGAVLNFVRDAQRAVSVDEIVRAVAGNEPPKQYLKRSVTKALEHHHTAKRVARAGEKWRLATTTSDPAPTLSVSTIIPALDEAAYRDADDTAVRTALDTENANRAEPEPALGPPTPRTAKTPEEALGAITRAGDMGLGAGQCAIMAISDDTLELLQAAGRIVRNHEDRWVVV